MISSVIEKSNLEGEDVDEVILGQVLTGGADKILLGKRQYYRKSQKKNLLLLLISLWFCLSQ